MTTPGSEGAAYVPPRAWRAVVRAIGGVHVLARHWLVIHDQGITYAHDQVERWRWWFGPPAVVHRGVVLRLVPPGPC